jgi:hypothetical protein
VIRREPTWRGKNLKSCGENALPAIGFEET